MSLDSHTHPSHHVHETAPLHDPVDAWHDHNADERPQHAHAEIVDTNAVMGVGVALFFVIVFAVVAVWGFYTWYSTQRLAELERTSTDSPAWLLRGDRISMLTWLEKGHTLNIPAVDKDTPARQINIIPVKQATDTVVEQYLNRVRTAGKPE